MSVKTNILAGYELSQQFGKKWKNIKKTLKENNRKTYSNGKLQFVHNGIANQRYNFMQQEQKN